MVKIRLASEVNNLAVCEAFGCYSKAAEEIRVKVGQLGFIKLLVCSKCKAKFVEPIMKCGRASRECHSRQLKGVAS
jgi:hypothetical protein